MKPKGLLVAVVLLALLGGGIWWSNKKQAATPDKPPANTTKLISLADDQFQEVRIKKLTGDVLDLKRQDGKWAIVQPQALPADQDAVTTLVTSLSALSADKTIEESATDLKPYGLDTPTLEVTITRKDGGTAGILIGDDTPTNSGAYAKPPGTARVYLLATAVKSGLDKTVNDLRDKRLLTFDSEKLTRLELTAKGTAMEFGKNGQGEWQILKPRPLRADSTQVDTFIGKLKDAKLDPLVSEEDAKKAAAAFPSAAKIATVTTSESSGSQTFDLRQDKDKTYYAKSSVVEGVFKLSADAGDALNKGLDDFRNKKLLDFGFSDPGKLELKGATYTKTGDKWTSGAKTMDSAGVQNLIDKLRDLGATKFSDKGAGDVVFEAAVTSNSGKRVEKVTIRKQAAQYFAQRDGEPSIYELDGKSVDDLQAAASAIKEAAPEPAKKK